MLSTEGDSEETEAFLLVQLSTNKNEHRFTVVCSLFLKSLHTEITGQCVQSLDMVGRTASQCIFSETSFVTGRVSLMATDNQKGPALFHLQQVKLSKCMRLGWIGTRRTDPYTEFSWEILLFTHSSSGSTGTRKCIT